jgi:monothiol glutaredoxin
MENKDDVFKVISDQVEEYKLDDNEITKNTIEIIKAMVSDSKVFIFMKGTPQVPQCGFSTNTLGILKQLKTPVKTFDVLSDFSIREEIKRFSNWPTIPQVYIDGKFIGGNDIVTELFNSGELSAMVNANIIRN